PEPCDHRRIAAASERRPIGRRFPRTSALGPPVCAEVHARSQADCSARPRPAMIQAGSPMSQIRTAAAPDITAARPLGAEELRLIDAYWRAANYLSAGQIYLLDNSLLK